MVEPAPGKYDYNRFGCKAQRVGQAVFDIVSKEQPDYTVGEILDEFGPKYTAEIQKSVEDGLTRYKIPFYVFVLTKKEMWACNVVRNFFIPRQTAPGGQEMMIAYPNYMKTLYKVISSTGDIKLMWTLPGYQDCRSISESPGAHDPDLVRWLGDCFSGEMDDEHYCDR